MANTKDYNPRNPKNTLYRKLTRLLSGPLADYRQQQPRQLKRRQLNKYNMHSTSGQSFKKGNYNPYEFLAPNFMSNQNRAERYADFDQMEFTPEIASALDIYADEMTTSTAINPLLTIKCRNEEIKFVLEHLYHEILNIDFNLFGWCRTMCKYGDYFLYLDIDEKEGVKYAVGLPSSEVERLEGQDKTNPNYVTYQWNSGGITFENWQVAHFRILGNDKYAPYGTSILDSARRIWRQLTLLEDAMMSYRIVRSPERRVFYVDVGNIPPEDVEQYMQKVMTQMKRNQIVDSDNGRVDLRYNPLSVEEDYFIPQRGNQSTRIESLPGGTYTGDIDDVKYLRDKLFSALKIPSSYLAQTESAGEDKTTLAQKDIRFARTIHRLQRSVLAELEKIGIVHLFTLGYRGKDLISFDLSLNNPSKLAELQELESWRTKFDVASAATEGFFSKRWISKNLFNLSEEEIQRMQREMFFDKKLAAALEGATEEGVTDAAPGGGGLEAEFGDLGDELSPDEAPGEGSVEDDAPIPEEDDVLLAEPGKRDTDKETGKITHTSHSGKTSTTTPKSKGKWYIPAEWDKRRDQKKKSYKSLYADEVGRSNKRNVVGAGSQELMRLGKGVFTEEEANYINEERNVLRLNNDLKALIERMESKKQ
jgi:hypothetical protein